MPDRENTSSQLSIRQAVILVGGFAKRMGSLASDTPKALLPVAGTPFLDYLVNWLATAGIAEIFFATGHHGSHFTNFIARGKASGRWHSPSGRAAALQISHEHVPLGSGGALKLLEDRLDSQFFVLNGDSFFDCDLIALGRQAEALPAKHAMISTRHIDDTSRYGRIEEDSQGRVTRFIEKGVTGPGKISTGISVLHSSALREINTLPCALEYDIFPRLAAEERLHACEQEGYFIDIGLPESYAAAQIAFIDYGRPTVYFMCNGVLTENLEITANMDKLRLIDGAADAVARSRRNGFRIVAINHITSKTQSPRIHVQSFCVALNVALRISGGWIDAFYPHPTDSSFGRTALKDHRDTITCALCAHDCTMEGSLFVSSKDSDVETAKALGIPALHFQGVNLDDFLKLYLPNRHASQPVKELG